MTTNNINEWVENAKAHTPASTTAPKGVKVVRKPVQKSRGVLIMEMADKLRPFLSKWFDGKYTDDGMLIQPAHIRGLALDMADGLLKQRQADNKASA